MSGRHRDRARAGGGGGVKRQNNTRFIESSTRKNENPRKIAYGLQTGRQIGM